MPDDRFPLELSKMGTPAHLAAYVTSKLPPDAQWKPYKHLLYMNEKIVEAVTDPEYRFLNVSVSVRSGKTELISKFLPVWYLGMYPDRQIAVVSYSEAMAASWGQFARDVMKEYGYELFGLKVDTSSESKTEWRIAGHRGSMRSLGIGGRLIGTGADCLIIDDPSKGEDVNAPASKSDLWEWYTGRVRSRLEPGGTLIVTMARWRPDDLTGLLLEQSAADPEGDQWESIELPALAEAPKDADEDWRDVIGRADGEALWPERKPREVLLREKASVGPLVFGAQYQQRPSSPEGDMFKVARWQFRPSVAAAGLRLVRAWDLAATEGAGDWTAGVLMGWDSQNRVFILDMQRFRKADAGVKQALRAAAQHDGRPIPIQIEQERAGAGKAQIAGYKRELIGWIVNGAKPEGTKEQRASGYASQQQDGNVYLVGPGPINEKGVQGWGDFIDEHRQFPNGRHDDQIDACSTAFEYLASTSGFVSLSGDDTEGIPFARLLAGIART